MKNSNENLKGGTWLLTFLQHQNALFYQNPKIFSATFAFILTCHKKPGRNPALPKYELWYQTLPKYDLVSFS